MQVERTDQSESLGNIAIIGGTGFEQLPPEIFAEPITTATRYGEVTVLSLSDNYTEPYKLFFMARHGAEHHLAPHQIDHRANIAALVELNVKHILATNAVGSLRLNLSPGTLVVIDDFIDFTRRRHTEDTDAMASWRHTDYSIPYSPPLRAALLTAAIEFDIPVVDGGTYLCCDGPRFETPAEIRMFAAWGGDVIGMTGLPEAIFAREADISYAALAIVTNYGAGLTPTPVDHLAVTAAMSAQIAGVRDLMIHAARHLVLAHASPPPP